MIRLRGRRQYLCSAYTLIELLVASAASTVVMGGMAGSIYIGSLAFDDGDSQSAKAIAVRNITDGIMYEMQYATRFYERTPRAVTFAVPDRDGDGSEETFRYAWSGVVGDPLTKELNGSAPAVLLASVKNLNFTFMTRTLIAPPLPVFLVPQVVFEEFTEAKLSSNGLALAVPVPPGTVAGDLLIVAMALDGNPDALAAPAGWNLLVLEQVASKVRLGVWWKIATAAEGSSYNFTWISNQQAYGWVMRFTGHDPAMPINNFAFNVGSSSTPITPAVDTTVDNTMILRIGGFDDDDITVDDSGMSGHTTITMDKSNQAAGTSSGGAAYAYQESADDTDTADFTLTYNRYYITTTIAIAPDPSP